MAELDYLQQILGTNKKNRVFSVSRHSQTNDYHVYYGAELFEIVPSDHRDIRFKLMVAHLRSAGATLTQLHETFKIDPRTITKWSNALKTGDAETLARALGGREAGRKLTPAAEEYIRIRFPSIYAHDRRAYSRKIREELKKVLNIEVSGETLRPLFGVLKAQFEPRQSSPGDPASDDDDDDDNGNDDGNVNPPPDSPAEAGSAPESEQEGPHFPAEPVGQRPGLEQPCKPNQEATKPCEALDPGPRSAPTDRKPYTEISKASWCSHLGLLLFSQPLFALRQALGEENGPVVCQWASQVLLGAQNLEQTKLQSRRDLSLLLGGGLLGSPDRQRKKLGELAEEPQLARDILRWNFQRVGGERMSDFYFDPHTKQYTGKQNVLKGWCSKIRWADKIMNGDYIHSTNGQPVYLENTDNYEDMRQRFKQVEERFRACVGIGRQRELTWIIDRGIFSHEIFDWVLESPDKHLITWEKGYERGSGWAAGNPAAGSMEVERSRNNKADKRTYRFEWTEKPWPKNNKVRRIIVKATNPEGNRIEVSILCDDWKRPAKDIIWLMFDRWVQENDFKYMDEHFGINQITSYLSETYAEIRGELKDREVKSAAYAALHASRRDEKNRMGKLLVLQREATRKEGNRSRLIAKLKALQSPDVEQRKQLGRLLGAQKSAEKHTGQRELKIEQIQKEIDRLDAELENTDKEASRLDTLIGKGAVRLCGQRKQLMDVIKITARNIFYEAFAPFKEAYDNYRDDHAWFRHLSHSGGVIGPAEEDLVLCSLIGVADLPKAVRVVVEKLLVKFHQSGCGLPDGSGRPIKLNFGSKSAIELASTDA